MFKRIILILTLICMIVLPVFGQTGSYTTHNLFYLPKYGAYGLTEYNTYNEYMEIADAQIWGNKPANNKLSAFAATTSAELAGVISDETGTGLLVFGTAPTFTNGITATDYIVFDDTDYNLKLGYQAGKNIVAGAINNLFIGYQAGLSGDGTSTNAADGNLAIGYQSLFSNTTGTLNLAIGYQALYSNTANWNSAIGYQALYSNTTGIINSAFGSLALKNNAGGVANSAFGGEALFNNTGGNRNIAIGLKSLYANTTGSDNTAIGWQAGQYQANGSTTLVTPEFSVYIGANAKGKDNDDSYSIVIGASAIGMGANTTVIGTSGTTTDAYINGNIHAVNSAYINTIVTMGDTDLTPDVSAGNVFISQSNTGATAITDLDNPVVGQTVTIICGHATNPPSIADGGNFKMEGNWTSDIDDSITFFVKADNYYVEISRSAN